MRRIKKFLACVLIVVMIATALASCNGGAQKETEGGKKTQKPTQAPNVTQKPTNSQNGQGLPNDNNGDGSAEEDNSKSQYIREDDTVYFGSYPQSEVTDTALTAVLTEKAGELPTADNANAWTSYGFYKNGAASNFMWYIDLENEGARYRGVYFTEYRPLFTTADASVGSSQDENGYHPSNVYWFKYEPLAWTVLSEENGAALVVCNMIIDAQAYQTEINYGSGAEGDYVKDTTVYSNNYEYSTVRAWLNDSFYSLAFNESEAEIILETTVDNSAAAMGFDSSKYACADTNDKVFLLSVKDITNEEYGHLPQKNYSDSARQKKTTAYAQALGAFTGHSEGIAYYTHGMWWLRSPCDDFQYGYVQVANGNGKSNYEDVVRTDVGVVPALRIKLS
jgi:hypothetical protein